MNFSFIEVIAKARAIVFFKEMSVAHYFLAAFDSHFSFTGHKAQTPFKINMKCVVQSHTNIKHFSLVFPF